MNLCKTCGQKKPKRYSCGQPVPANAYLGPHPCQRIVRVKGGRCAAHQKKK